MPDFVTVDEVISGLTRTAYVHSDEVLKEYVIPTIKYATDEESYVVPFDTPINFMTDVDSFKVRLDNWYTTSEDSRVLVVLSESNVPTTYNQINIDVDNGIAIGPTPNNFINIRTRSADRNDFEVEVLFTGLKLNTNYYLHFVIVTNDVPVFFYTGANISILGEKRTFISGTARNVCFMNTSNLGMGGHPLLYSSQTGYELPTMFNPLKTSVNIAYRVPVTGINVFSLFGSVVAKIGSDSAMISLTEYY